MGGLIPLWAFRGSYRLLSSLYKLLTLLRQIDENPEVTNLGVFFLTRTGGARTHNLLLRQIVLYPIELQP